MDYQLLSAIFCLIDSLKEWLPDLLESPRNKQHGSFTQLGAPCLLNTISSRPREKPRNFTESEILEFAFIKFRHLSHL